MRWGIQAKGFFVVAVPLAFTIVFVSVLCVALRSNLEQLEHAAHAKAVLSSTGYIQLLVEDGAMRLAEIKSEHNPAKRESLVAEYDALTQGAPDALAKLKKAVEKIPDEKIKAENIDEKTQSLLPKLEECKQNLLNGNQFAALSDMPVLFKDGFFIKKQLDDLGAKYRSVDAVAIEIQAGRTKVLLFLLLPLALLTSIAISLFLARYFFSNFSSRVLVLIDNTKRLVAGQELHPVLKDPDEIGSLDVFFRKMSVELQRAQDEQKALTIAAQTSEENTRMVIENMPIGILVVSADNKIESLNPQAEKMFKCDINKVVELPLQRLLPGDSTVKSGKKTNDVKLSQSVAESPAVDTIALRVDGEQFPAEVAVSKFSTDAGKHYLVTVQDISERYEMERLKREFVAMVSHDLRTPLTALQGTLDLLDEDSYGVLTDKGHVRVKAAGESVERLVNLINDLLDIEKLEAGMMRLERKPTRISAILNHSIESVRTFAEHAEVTLEWAEREELSANVDRDRIIQVLINLLSNSVKFSPPGAKVTVTATRDGDMALIQVEDRGRGIPKEFVGSLFERFKQVKANDGARKKGTGLGLAISKAIVESHGGKIGVTSEENKGSVFYFTVPLN